MVEFPSDLTEFLTAGKSLEYDASACECGQTTLLRLGEHRVSEIWIDGETLRDVAIDPNAGKEGYYALPAVNLVAECEGYEPEHILTWLPESHVYGAWDCDHWSLTVFPETDWNEIAADPLPYINEQWEPNNVGVPLVPWPDYPFKQGKPS